MASQPVKKRTKRCSIKNPILFLNLPHDVVENIFSFFSIKQAVRLSLLSKRFKNSWRINRNLCFDNSVTKGRQRADVIKIINRVFDLHRGTSINKFGLCFDPIGLEELLVNWIKRAVSKGVEELELDFKKCRRRYKLPSFIFSIESLGVLKVAGCKLEVSPQLKGFHSLKALVLKEVEVTSGSLDVLLYKCLRLESLELVKCYPIFDGKIESKNLKILRLESCYGNFSSISIDTPSLCSLHYDGCIRRINFSSKMQLLNDAILNFRTRSYRNLSQGGELILEVAYVNVLTVNGTFLEGLSPRFVDSELRGPQFLLLNLKEFNLSMGISHINPSDIVVFLENCPLVERIFIDLGDSSFENGYYWVYHAKEKFEQCNPSFERLKIIEVKGFKFRRLEIEMVKFFLEKARSLERLALVSSKNKYLKFFSQDVNIYELFLSWGKSPKVKIEMFWR